MPGTEVDAGAALAAAARFGPYFAWQPHTGEPGWRPMAELLDPAVVTERVAHGRRVLLRMSGSGTDEIGERVVASTIFLGLASRLVSPLLAATSLTGVLPVADPGRLRWRAVESGPLPISYGKLEALDGTAEALNHVAVRRLVAPLLEVFQRTFVLSPRVLWGNVASALGGAAGMIADAPVTPPSPAANAATLVERLLAMPPLAGTATLHHPDPEQARWFLERHNCCLYYRIPGGGTCGDCVLVPDDQRRRQWQAVLARRAGARAE